MTDIPDSEAQFQRFVQDTFQRILYQNLDAQSSLLLINACTSFRARPFLPPTALSLTGVKIGFGGSFEPRIHEGRGAVLGFL